MTLVASTTAAKPEPRPTTAASEALKPRAHAPQHKATAVGGPHPTRGQPLVAAESPAAAKMYSPEINVKRERISEEKEGPRTVHIVLFPLISLSLENS